MTPFFDHEREALAYCAGIIDGEGYLGIYREKPTYRSDRRTYAHHARATVRMTQPEAVRFLAVTLGGRVGRAKAYVPNGRPLLTWDVSDAAAERALRAVLPWLRVKRVNAETVLALRDLQAEGRKHRTKVIGHRNFTNQYGALRRIETKCYSDEYIDLCDSLWQRCKDLNARGLDSGEEVVLCERKPSSTMTV